MLSLSCIRLDELLADILVYVADPGDERRQEKIQNTIWLLQKEAQRKAAPVSMGKLDTRQWLEMQSAAPLESAIAEELPVTRALAAPKYSWENNDEGAQSER